MSAVYLRSLETSQVLLFQVRKWFNKPKLFQLVKSYQKAKPTATIPATMY